MAGPTDKITEENIRRLVSESKNSFNPLSMTFTYEYAANLVELNWSDMRFAIENNFLSHKTAVEHALMELEKNENAKEEVFELVYLLPNEVKFPYDIYRLVDRLASSYNSGVVFKSIEKFLYVSLNRVYEHINDYSAPVGVVDISLNLS